MNTPEGWYYADGDPPGTVRRWNGTAWVGFPIADPSAPVESRTKPETVAVFGQKPLRPTGVFVSMALVWLAFALLVGALGSPTEISRIRVVVMGTTLPAAFLSMIGFVFWFHRAYRNISLWSTPQRSPIWAIIGWLIPIVNLYAPFTMMLELIEESPHPRRRGSLNPLIAFLWWGLWVLPSFAVPLTLVWVSQRDVQSRAEALETVESAWIVIVLAFVLNALSILLGMYLVHTISREQDIRLSSYPTEFLNVSQPSQNKTGSTGVKPGSSR